MKLPWKSNDGDIGEGGNYDGGSEASGPPLEAVVTIPIHHGAGTNAKGRDKPSGSDYSHLLCPTYGILMVLVGLILPMTEALGHKWHMTVYNMIYNVYSLGLAVLSVIYLQWLLLSQRRHSITEPAGTGTGTVTPMPKPSATPEPVDVSYDRRSLPCPLPQIPNIVVMPPSPMPTDDINDDSAEIASSSVDVVVDRPPSPTDHFSDDEVSGEILSPGGPSDRQRRSSEVSISVIQFLNERRRFSLGASSVTPASGVTAKIRLGGIAENGAVPTEKRMSNLSTLVNNEIEQGAWIDLMKLGSVFSHEGSNLYLRLWELGFALGNVVYIILEIQFQMSSTTVACSGTYGWTFMFRLVFIVAQTFFLFKNQTFEIEKHEVLVRFALMHLIATNMSVWLRTLINEIMFEYEHLNMHHISNHAGTDNSTPAHVMIGDCDKLDKLIETTSPYLFPFVLEYSLIAMGTLTVMYSAVDEATDEQANTLRRIQNLFRVPALAASYAEDKGILPILTKSHRGFFVGILVLSGGFVAIVMFYFLTTDASKALVYLISLISLHTIMLFATGVAVVKMNQLSYIARPVSVDDTLLFLSVSGEVVYELSIIMASSDFIATQAVQDAALILSANVTSTTAMADIHYAVSDQHELTTEILRLTASCIALIQAVLQVLLTISGLRRYPSSLSHVEEMPGRGVITFLIVANVSVWICRTALVKAVSVETMIHYYSTLPWLLLANINLPLLLFYRFHSSVCLADIWHSAYTSPASSAEHHSKPAKMQAAKPPQHRRSSAFCNTTFEVDHDPTNIGHFRRYSLHSD